MGHFVRSPYNYDVRAASLEAAINFYFDVEPSRTVQSEKDQADINVIVKNFGLTGKLPLVDRPPSYGDFEGVFDYQTARNLIRAADESFMGLSAEVRSRFSNDPAKFVEFCSDESNIEEMRKLGLAIAAPKVDTPVAPDGGAS